MSEVKDSVQEPRIMSNEELGKINNLKQLIVDTETTGLYVDKGEKLVEIAAIEVIGGIPTGKKFHAFVNPQRKSQPEAFAVHRISDEFLSKQPLFSVVAQDFLDFVAGYEVVMHNAPFDTKFLDEELKAIGLEPMSNVVKDIVCTLAIDKANYTGKHKLDDMCRRFNIDLSKREEDGHNAVLDCELLAQAYRAMILDKGWEAIRFDPSMKDFEAPEIERFDSMGLNSVKLTQEEELGHQAILASILKNEKQTPIFNKEVVESEAPRKSPAPR